MLENIFFSLLYHVHTNEAILTTKVRLKYLALNFFVPLNLTPFWCLCEFGCFLVFMEKSKNYAAFFNYHRCVWVCFFPVSLVSFTLRGSCANR